jgi:DDE superfamily endonuclease
MVRVSFLAFAARLLTQAYSTINFPSTLKRSQRKWATQQSTSGVSLMGLLKRRAGQLASKRQPTVGTSAAMDLKFQNVTTPNGYLAHLYGLIAGSQHDSYMLSCSDLLPQLHTLMPQGQGTIYSLFGDLAYPMSAYLYRDVTQLAAGSIEAAWNTKMSSAPMVVKWTFGEVGKQFHQLDLKQALMIYKFPVAIFMLLLSSW